MIVENEVDINLLYLEKFLFSLHLYTFDDDINQLINELQKLLSKKLYSALPNNDYKITKEIIKIKFYLEKEKFN